MLRAAGLAWDFQWFSEGDGPFDIYYGPPGSHPRAAVEIHSGTRSFCEIAGTEPDTYRESDGLPFLGFGPDQPLEPLRQSPSGVVFANDILLSSYWLLSGAREPGYARDRSDNLDLSNSFFLRHGLQRTPIVSLYAAFLRRFFADKEPLAFPAAGALSFTHDVDYPQIIRWIECLRMARGRGLGSLPSIAGILNGTNHFWKFGDWVEFESEFGTRPAFYFMARQGSLLQYARGTPDAFYNICTAEFRRLFGYLKEEGCEVGLHASYHAHRNAGQIGAEKRKLEAVAGTVVEGGRHHYWHLNPEAPNDTLLEHERAGLVYDSSLGFEFYPGFRRGMCHPFRVFHPGQRREIATLQLPPTWMDDHFDRRLEKNRITDSDSYAAALLGHVKATGGIAVLDYHARGMNSDFYPRYGAWLRRFAEKHFDSSLGFLRPAEIARIFRKYEAELARRSSDRTGGDACALAS
jgi:hypothetical protein